MAGYLASKVSTEVVRRSWTVPVDADDAPASASLSASGVTVDANEFIGSDLVLTLSGGTAATTGSIVATITTNQGRTLIETLYLPIVQSAAQIADTARDYVTFALRRRNGPRAATDTQLDYCLEHLNAIVATWRAGGADIGAAFPIEADTVIYCPDYVVMGLRNALLVNVLPFYGVEPTPMEYENARRGLQLIKHKNLPVERVADYY